MHTTLYDWFAFIVRLIDMFMIDGVVFFTVIYDNFLCPNRVLRFRNLFTCPLIDLQIGRIGV